VTFVRPSHPAESFGNFSTPFGTLARDVHDPVKRLTENLSVNQLATSIVYKSSAVAEMGDRLATIDMGRKWGGATLGRAGSPMGHHDLTQCGLGRGLPLYQVAS